MKLIFYEIKKILCKKVFFILLALSLVLNVGIFYYTQNHSDSQLYISEDYINLVDEYSSMSLKEAEQKLRAKNEAYEILSYMNLLADAQSMEEMQVYFDALDEYKAESPDAYSQAENMLSSDEYNDYEQVYIYDLISQVDYIKSYPDFIDEMRSRADEQSSFSIFGNQNDFSYKNLYKTADDYKHLSGINLSIGNNLPVTTALSFKMTDYLLVAMVFLVCIYIFYSEKDKGLYNLVRSSKNGRFRTIVAKLSALFIITALISIVFALSNFAVSIYLYGGFDLNRAIQSIPDFRNCIFEVNIGQFCMLTIFGKALGMIIIVFIFALFFIVFSSPLVMYGAGICLVVAEYLLYNLIPSGSAFKYARYINIFYLPDGYNFFGCYLNLNILAYPICSYVVDTAVFATVFVVCTTVACIIFTLKKQTNKESVLSGVVERFKNKHFKINGRTSVFYGELYKYLIQNKMTLLLIALVVFSAFSSFGTVRYPYSLISDPSYKSYMEYLEGDITEEKIDYIAEQNRYFDTLRQKIEKIGEDETLSENAKSVATNSIQKILETDGEAFERINAQYERLTELQKNGTKASFIDENLYPNFVFNPSREWNNLVLLLIVLIMSVPFIYTVEYKNGMIDLIRPAKYGKLTLMCNKLAILILTLLISFTAVYLPYLIRFINTYGTNSFNSNLICLEIYQNTGGNISIIGAFALTVVCYFMIALFAVGVITLVSVLCKNHLLSMIISTVVVLIPCLVLYSSENIRAGAIFYGNYAMTAFATISICIVASLLCIVIAGLIFTNWSRRCPAKKRGCSCK